MDRANKNKEADIEASPVYSKKYNYRNFSIQNDNSDGYTEWRGGDDALPTNYSDR
jgi:hypothetical protein